MRNRQAVPATVLYLYVSRVCEKRVLPVLSPELRLRDDVVGCMYCSRKILP